MPETNSNVELARDLNERGHEAAARRTHRRVDFAEAIILAFVAVATAWSGYQASRWDGVSTQQYALYEHSAVQAESKNTLAGQDRLYDIVTFNGWAGALVSGHPKLVAYFERRFRPEYAAAYKAWWKLDPLHNKAAPAGPIFMPQYKNENEERAVALEAGAEKHFETAVSAKERADDYVRVTVFLATVLFLTALSQRFEFEGPRMVIVAIALVLLAIGLFSVVTLPRS